MRTWRSRPRKREVRPNRKHARSRWRTFVRDLLQKLMSARSWSHYGRGVCQSSAPISG